MLRSNTSTLCLLSQWRRYGDVRSTTGSLLAFLLFYSFVSGFTTYQCLLPERTCGISRVIFQGEVELPFCWSIWAWLFSVPPSPKLRTRSRIASCHRISAFTFSLRLNELYHIQCCIPRRVAWNWLDRGPGHIPHFCGRFFSLYSYSFGKYHLCTSWM